MKTKAIILTLALAFGAFSFSAAQDGEKLFKGNCASCHSIGKGKVVGPDLKGVNDKRDEKWLMSWIRGSQKMIKDGDTLATRLYNENNKVMMPDAVLNEDEIKTVLAYIKTKGEQPETVAAAAPATNTQNNKDAEGMAMIKFSFTEYMLAGIVIFLLIVVWTLTKSIKTLSAELSRHYDSQY